MLANLRVAAGLLSRAWPPAALALSIPILPESTIRACANSSTRTGIGMSAQGGALTTFTSSSAAAAVEAEAEAAAAAGRSGSTGGGGGAEPGDGGAGDTDGERAALAERKRRSVHTYLEQQLGGADPDRVTLAVLLQRHGVVVRGGQPEALRLMEALVAWKRGDWLPTEDSSAAGGEGGGSSS